MYTNKSKIYMQEEQKNFLRNRCENSEGVGTEAQDDAHTHWGSQRSTYQKMCREKGGERNCMTRDNRRLQESSLPLEQKPLSIPVSSKD